MGIMRPVLQLERVAEIKRMSERDVSESSGLRKRRREKSAGKSRAKTMPLERKGKTGSSCALVPVRTVTVTGTVVPSGATEGATVQVALTGAPAQERATVPLKMESELSWRVYIAEVVVVLETVTVVGPVAANVKSMPVPESAAVCVGVGALSTNVTEPVIAPGVEGAKTIWTVQAELTASDDVQVLDAMTKPVEEVMEAMLSGWPPLLVRVMGCAVVVRPSPVGAKERDEGEMETPGGAMPVPLRATVWERSSSVTVSAAERAPVAVGMKLT